jgi:hypothetical protein
MVELVGQNPVSVGQTSCMPNETGAKSVKFDEKEMKEGFVKRALKPPVSKSRKQPDAFLEFFSFIFWQK